MSASSSYRPIVIGIDPGLQVTGYGILEQIEGQTIVKDYGVIRPPATLSIGEKLCIIQQSLRELILQYNVEAMSIETQYVFKNPASAIKLGMVRGVALALAANVGIGMFEYAPTRIKKAVTGKGGASKKQIQVMIALRLELDCEPPEDAADALAMAFCHLQQNCHFELLRSS
jgi:crossover junction endodeoxyribonuclease RuvC